MQNDASARFARKIKCGFFTLLMIAGLSFPLYCSAQTFTLNASASIGFDDALALTKISDAEFGVVKATTAETYTLSTAGVLTASGSATNILRGTPAAANIRITGSATQTIDYSVGSYTAHNGVTPSNATCSYNGAASGSCNQNNKAAPGSAGKTLLIGVRVAVNGTQAAGTTATPSFIVTVVYN